MPIALLLAGVLCLPALPDDLVPAAIEDLIEQPEDPIFFGLPGLAPGIPIFINAPVGSARCVVDLGDVTGDGTADLAVGYTHDSIGAALVAYDGANGAVLWSDTPDAGGFRSLTGLSARAGRLALGVSSVHARVASRDSATGDAHWTRDLQPGGGQQDINVLFVRFVDDQDGDGLPELLVGVGEGLNALYLLAGADGTTIWSRSLGGPVYAACPAPDLDGDAVPDVYAVGGDGQPFAARLSGTDGSTIWSVPLPGPGAAVLPLQDVQGNGTTDLAVGLFATPADCLVTLDGGDGSQIWAAESMTHNVTSLAPLGDIDGDGLDDFTAGSFENMVPGVSTATGALIWRSEISTNNTGALLSVAAAGDLDGNGAIDVYSSSMDHLAYVFDGAKGYLLSTFDTRSRGIAVAALADSNGDGRPEFAIAGQGRLQVLAGDSGIADGPIVVLIHPKAPLGEMTVIVFAYPGKLLGVMGSLSTGFVQLPGYGGAFGLDPAAFGFIHLGTAPAAGQSGYLIGPFPRQLLGMHIYLQAVTTFEPGNGLFSKVLDYHSTP